MGRYPFDVSEVAALLQLEIRQDNGAGIYTDCPFCGRKRKLYMHRQRQVFRCNYCDSSGNMLTLYASLYGKTNQESYREICDALHYGTQRPTAFQPQTVSRFKGAAENTLADINTRHETYSQMLKLLPLSNENRKNLNQRGLSDSIIMENGYASTPSNQCQIVQKLLKQGCVLKGVPGFFQTDSGAWQMRSNDWTAGFFVPVRDEEGRIQGMQIRLNHGFKDGTKYIWFSSLGFQNGTSAGAAVHIVGNPKDTTVFVTEGALKSDIAHSMTGRTFIAAAGVNQYRSLAITLKKLKRIGVKKVVECYDVDKFKNIHVMRGSIMLCLIAQKLGFQTKNVAWDNRYKGIDDLHYALHQAKIQNAGFCYYDLLSLARWQNYNLKDFIEMYDISLKYMA